jgi:hypothetical protein
MMARELKVIRNPSLFTFRCLELIAFFIMGGVQILISVLFNMVQALQFKLLIFIFFVYILALRVRN